MNWPLGPTSASLTVARPTAIRLAHSFTGMRVSLSLSTLLTATSRRARCEVAYATSFDYAALAKTDQHMAASRSPACSSATSRQSRLLTQSDHRATYSPARTYHDILVASAELT